MFLWASAPFSYGLRSVGGLDGFDGLNGRVWRVRVAAVPRPTGPVPGKAVFGVGVSVGYSVGVSVGVSVGESNFVFLGAVFFFFSTQRGASLCVF